MPLLSDEALIGILVGRELDTADLMPLLKEMAQELLTLRQEQRKFWEKRINER